MEDTLNHGDVFTHSYMGSFVLVELPITNLWVLIAIANGNYWCRPGTDPEDAFAGEMDKFVKEKTAKPRPAKFLLFSFPEGSASGFESVFKGSCDDLREALRLEDSGLFQIVCRDTLAVIFDPLTMSRSEFMASIEKPDSISKIGEN